MFQRIPSILSIGTGILLIFVSIYALVPDKEEHRKIGASEKKEQTLPTVKPEIPRIVAIPLPAPPQTKATQSRKVMDPKQATSHILKPQLKRKKQSLKGKIMTARKVWRQPDYKILKPRKPELNKKFYTATRKRIQKSEDRTKNSKVYNFQERPPKKVKQNQMPDPGGQIPVGRVLLRLLEHGKGPTIDIAWPEQYRDRQRLFTSLRTCYGMKIAVMTSDKRLFSRSNPPGIPWRPNSDAYSGFLRSPIGQQINNEILIYREITNRNRLDDGKPVRIFPRNVDAVILSGFQRLIGKRYHQVYHIQEHYRLEPGIGVYLERIKVNERPVDGVIKIPPIRNSGCMV